MNTNTALIQSTVQHITNGIITQYAPLVKRIANYLVTQLPSTILLDDLIQAGMLGLLEAAKHYKPDKGACFKTYASIRIRGSMLDEVRRNDWVPRSVHRNTRNIAKAEQKAANRAGRDAKAVEVAQELGVSLSEYHDMLRDVIPVQLHAFEEGAGVHTTEHAIFEHDLYNRLIAIFEVLPDKERLVLSLYYDHELNLKQIGTALKISESRACQIHNQAMQRIKSKLYQ